MTPWYSALLFVMVEEPYAMLALQATRGWMESASTATRTAPAPPGPSRVKVKPSESTGSTTSSSVCRRRYSTMWWSRACLCMLSLTLGPTGSCRRKGRSLRDASWSVVTPSLFIVRSTWKPWSQTQQVERNWRNCGLLDAAFFSNRHESD
jgi:hypothetical protein